MKRLLILAATFAALLATGCGNTGINNDEVNRRCAPYGGVLSVDFHGDSYVCADRKVRDY